MSGLFQYKDNSGPGATPEGKIHDPPKPNGYTFAVGLPVAGVIIFLAAVISWAVRKRSLKKKLKDPNYLPNYFETFGIVGGSRTRDEDLEIAIPPPDYDAANPRPEVEHIPVWFLDDSCSGLVREYIAANALTQSSEAQEPANGSSSGSGQPADPPPALEEILDPQTPHDESSTDETTPSVAPAADGPHEHVIPSITIDMVDDEEGEQIELHSMNTSQTPSVPVGPPPVYA